MPDHPLYALLPAETASPEETLALGERLAAHLAPGDVLALYGDLGAGKTHLVKGLARGLGADPEDVSSPTFTLVNEYATDPPLHHLDVYRIERLSELEEIGVEELLHGDGLCVVEWPERMEPMLPPGTLRVRLLHLDGDRRRVEKGEREEERKGDKRPLTLSPFHPLPLSPSLPRMTYPEALALLDALPRFADAGAAAYKPGLDRMTALMDAMGRPHARLRAVHVAGTNGKGSTASMVAAVGTASGRRVGLHTSPHLFDFAERLRLDGRPTPHDWIADAVARHRDDLARIAPSYFEASVALSFLYFAEAGADLAVVEVGLGGRLDATNVLPTEALAACGVTAIGLDHTDLLGTTLPEIAREKAGIAKPGVPLLTSAEGLEVLAAITVTAAAAGAPVERVRETVALAVEADAPEGLTLRLRTPVRDYGRVRLGLAGAHQAWNAALAVRLAEVAMPDASPEAVRAGLADVRRLSGLHGRCEAWQAHPRIVADVAHNPDGWRAALACARPVGTGRLWTLVGVMADKDVDGLAALLAEAGATALPVALPSARAMGRGALAARLAARGVPVVDVADVAAGVAHFRQHAGPEDVLLVTGSHLAVEALGRAS